MKTLLLAFFAISLTAFGQLPFDPEDFYFPQIHEDLLDPGNYYQTNNYFPPTENPSILAYDPSGDPWYRMELLELGPEFVPNFSTGEINLDPSALGLTSGDISDFGSAALSAVTWSTLTGKPSFFSGAYSDLTGKPTLGTAAAQNTSAFDASGSASAAQAFSIQRANHTGTQSVSTITGLATVATSGAYADLSGKPSIPSAQVQSDWTQLNSGAVDFIKNKPAVRTQSAQTRSFNSGFQVSTTRDSLVTYSVDVSCTSTLASGQTGTVFLEIASDSGFTTNLQEVGRFVNSCTQTLGLTVTMVQAVTGNIGGYVPAGYYVRLRTANTLGTPTFTYRSGQEVLF